MQQSEKWAVLQMVNDWVKYSDTKAALVLGFQGAVAGFFFSQRSELSQLTAKYGYFTGGMYSLGILLLVASLLLAALTVYPRLAVGESKSNIFFAHIGKIATADDYRARLSKPSVSFEVDVENQIWANGVVAWRKYQLTAYSIGVGILSYLALGVAGFSAWFVNHAS